MGSMVASAAPAVDYRLIHQFGGPDGNKPTFMIQASNGSLYGTASLGGVGAQGVGNGTIYRISPEGNFTLLHAFTDIPDGSLPFRLLQASNGLIYVVTASGGQFGQGAIFRMDLAGNLTNIHSFTGGADGSGPSYLTEVSPGVFYGTTGGGGAAPPGCHLPTQGVVYRMDAAGSVTPLHTFCENIDGSGPNSLVQTADGGFLGTAREDGPLGVGSGSGTLWKMSAVGDVTLLHVFIGNTVAIHDAAQPGSLVKGPDGLYYGIGDGGGQSSNGAIFRTDEAGHIEIVHHFNDYATDGADPGGLIRGADGFFYGNAFAGGLPIGGSDQGVVYRFDTAGHTWVLHSFDYTHGGAPSQPFLTDQGVLVGNTLFGGTGFAPMGTSYLLRPNTPVSELELQRDVLHPGQSTNGRITLATPAPAGGQVVRLFSTTLQLPSQVTVAAGSKTAIFHVQAGPGTGTFVATITAYIGSRGESIPLRIEA
jgi:uncharacterized repeat protein (TIGR03803 family)